MQAVKMKTDKMFEDHKKRQFIDFILEQSKTDDKWYMLCSVLGSNSVICYSSREAAEKETDENCGDMKDWALHTLIHKGNIICSGNDWEKT